MISIKEEYRQHVRDRIFDHLIKAEIISYEDSCKEPNFLEKKTTENLNRRIKQMVECGLLVEPVE